jgi:type 1 fimbriae regulatory protein FimE
MKKSTRDDRLSFSAKSTNSPPPKPRNKDVRTREHLTASEITKLKEAAAATGRHGLRDWLIITMMYRHALRAGELVDLRWDQVDLRGRLHVNRLKNGDPSTHSLEGDEIRSLRKIRRDYPASDFVFCSERQGPLTTRSVHHIIARAGVAAGIKFPVHPHMLRHSKGYQLANRGEDTRAIQGYMGHKNIQHTVLYTKLDSRRFRSFGRD